MGKVLSTPFQVSPGIQRDGTAFMAQACLDGAWVRFYMGTPMKIGGVQALFSVNDLCAPSATISALGQFPLDNNVLGILAVCQTADTQTLVLSQVANLGRGPFVIGQFQALGAPPAFTNTTYWQYQIVSYTCLSEQYPDPLYLVSCSNPKVQDGGSFLPAVGCSATSNVYWCSVTGSGTLLAVTDPNMGEIVSVSGGVCVFQPGYIFVYGSNGTVVMNNPLAPDPVNTFSVQVGGAWVWNQFVIATTSIIKGMACLGNVPSGYFWSMNSVISCQIQEDNLPSFSTISEEISVISAGSIVNVNNAFYWIGLDTFYVCAGYVQEVSNTMNRVWFFENVNMTYAPLIFGVVNRLFNEIWWFFPKGSSQVCNHVLIFNYKLNVWYDTPWMQNASQTAAYAALPATFAGAPLVASNTLCLVPQNGRDVAYQYASTVSRMETGTDYVDPMGGVSALASSVRYNLVNLYAQQSSVAESWMQVRRVEIDIRQTGPVMMRIMAMHFPRDYLMGSTAQPDIKTEPSFSGEEQDYASYILVEGVRYVDFSVQGRLISVEFLCNQEGAAFHLGNMLMNWTAGSNNSGSKFNLAYDGPDGGA